MVHCSSSLFNDVGEWIVILADSISASSSELLDWIREDIDKYGQLWTVHMTDDGATLCFENGYRLKGNVPDTLREKLRETELDVYRVKFLSGGAYFIADQDGQYAYYM